MNLEDVILRGLAAARPLATDVPSGTLYYSTDTATTDRSNGAAWQTYSDVGAAGTGDVIGPAVAVDDRIATFDGTTGKLIQDGAATIAGVIATAVAASAPTVAQRTRQIGITIDGGGSVLTTGLKGFRSFPIIGTITGVRLLADLAGAIVIDIWKDTYANFPPVVGDSITAAAKPTIPATNQKAEDTTLTGWTTAVAAGDVFAFNIDSVATIKRITLELTIVIP